MAKELNQQVNLSFTADTAQAKAQLQDLQNQLTKLINNPTATGSIGITKEIQDASVAAATLKTQLQEATNVNTGKLDLGKFNQSLQQSGYNIKTYKEALSSLGPEGRQAFATLAQSITTAEVPLRRSSALLTEFATTLKNTARWQISSSILHGFMGSLQSAYSYAQDLNESLNNIRIVTGQSAEQMADFAKQANEAAKSLSTTTTAYTDAALIFYQQGLTGKDVTDRTDTVIKMANVTGQSASEVSSYMTAIWNNFDDGSTSLEHYADVITNLGAHTASSSEEIAEGLEKFASVGETVGLSYEYATSALATVVAQTRQSADTVGTAFKTLFARIQDLELGDTLDDGTTLGSYSQALEKIGVNIKDANGEVKDMNTILDEMGAKWDTIDKGTQIAVAQAVAGTRQYTQLIALMDNYDTFQQNLGYANDSEGSLQEQANVYADSWEAASKRVKASAQSIYDTLLDDDFFIGLNNVFADLLDTVNGMIDGLGGLKGVLLAVASILLNVYKNQAAQALQDVQYSFMMMTETGRKKLQELRTETNSELKTLFSDDASVSGNMMGEAYASQAKVQTELLDNAKNMTAEQQKIAQLLLDQHTTLVQNVAESHKLAEESENQANASQLKSYSSLSKIGIDKSQINSFASMTKQAQAFDKAITKAFGGFNVDKIGSQVDQLKQQMKSLRAVFKEDEEIIAAFGDIGGNAFLQFEQDVEAAEGDPEKLAEALAKLFGATSDATSGAEALGNKLREMAGDSKEANNAINDLEEKTRNAGSALGDMAGGMVNVETSANGFAAKLKQIPNATNLILNGFVSLAQTLSTVSMAISSINSLINTWKEVAEGSVEPGEALIETLTTLGFVIPMLVNSFRNLNVQQLAAVAAALPTAFGFTTEGLAAVAAGEATATFGTILYTVLWPLGLITAAIAALVGAVYLIVQAVKAVEAAKPEGVLKSAKEAAQEAAEAAQDVAEAYNNVKTALDDLESGIDAIDELERGTLEWRQAIVESNDALIDLLSTYDMLSSDNFTTNADGLMQITDEAKETLLNQAADKSAAANSASYAAQVRVNNAENRVNASEASQNITVMRSDGESTYDAATANSQLSADIGMAVANAINSNQLNTDDLINGSDALVKVLEKNANVTDEEAKSIAEQIAGSDELVQGMSELATEVAANTEANRILNNQIVESNFGEDIDSSGLSDENQENLENLMGADLEELTDKLYEDTYKDKGKLGGGMTDAEVQKAYAEAMGYATDTIENKSGNKAKYYNEDGSEVGVISDETARRYLAQQAAIEQMQGDVQGYIDTMNNLINTGNQIATGVGDAMASFVGGNGGDLSNLTYSDEQELSENVSGYDSATDTFKIGNETIDSERAQALGYDSVEEYYNAIQGALDAYEEDYANAGADTLSDAAKTAFDSIGKRDDISLSGQEAIAGVVEDAFIASGREGAQEVADLLDSDKISDVDSFSKALDGIDWDATSVEQLKDTMRDAGINTNLTDEEWQLLINTMQNGNGIIADATTQYKALHDVIDDLAAGDTISEEDYQALGGDIYDSFFLKMADGTYKLTTDAQTFYDVVNKKSIDNFKNNIDQINNLKNSGYDIDTLSQSAMTGKTNDNGVKTYNGNQVQSQLDYLSATGYTDTKQLAEWQDAIANSENVTVDMINAIGEAVASTSTEWDTLDETLEDNQEQLASTATSLDELHFMLDQDEISAEAFTKAAMAMDAAEDLEGLDTDELKDYANYLQDAAEDMEGFNDSMDSNEAQIVAKGIMKMNDAIDTLADNFVDSGKDADSWSDILKKSEKTSEEYADAMINTKNAVADLLDISSEYVSNDFIIDHLDEISKAATGDAEAIDNLKSELSSSVADTLAAGLSTSTTEADALRERLQGLIDDATQFDNLEVGASLYLEGEDGFVAGLNSLIAETGMTVDQVNALCDSMGFEANFAEEGQEVTTKIPEYTTHHEITDLDYTTLDNGMSVPVYNEKSWTEQTGEHEAVGEAAAFSMTTDGSTPKINSVTKKASGSSNNYSSSNKGGKSTPGKSSSSGSSKSKETKDAQKSELDPYHDIQRSIDRLTKSMEKLDKKQEHLYGSELIASLREENSQLDQQIANYQALGAVISSELSRQQGELSAYGVTFDATTGEMLNYTEAYLQVLATYNAAIAAYNASEQSDADKKALENAKKAYDDFQDLIDKYDETLDKQMENESDILDAQYQEIENNYKAWETEIQVSLDLSEAKQDWQKFVQKVNKDIRSTFKNYKSELSDIASNFNLYRDGTLSTDLKAVSDIEAEIDKIRSGQGSSIYVSESEAANDLLEKSNTLRDDAEELYDMYTEAWDEYLDAIDQVIDKWGDLLDEFDSINDSLEHNIEVIELLYGDGTKAKQLNAQMYTVQNANNIADMSTLKAYTTALEKEKAELLAAGHKETDEDVKKITDQIKENESEMESLIENYLQGLADQFANSVSLAMDTMEKTLMGGSSYDTVSQHWQDAMDAADGYYDEVERIYQLESLESKWESAINSTSTLKNQQKLKELMDAQLENLENKTTLSEYDIELSEKQLAVAQAQIALEEAQNSKDSMKLTRDESGNWSYQYVADEDDVAEKQQALLDANNEWYELVKENYQEAVENLIETAQTAQERLSELMEEYNTADAERRAEIEEEYNYLYDYYYGEEGLIATKSAETAQYQDDLNIATMDTLWSLYEQDEENYNIMTDTEKGLIDDLKDHGVTQYSLLQEAVAGEGGIYEQMRDKCIDVNSESLDSWKTEAAQIIQTWSTNPDSVKNAVKQMYADVVAAQKVYDKAVYDGTTASGVDYTNLGKQVDILSGKISNATSKTQELVNETDEISVMASAVDALRAEWESVYAATMAAISALENYLSILYGGSGSSGSGNSNNTGSTGNTGGTGTTGTTGSTGSGVADDATVAGIAAAIWIDGGSASGWGNNPTRSSELTAQYGSETAAAVQSYINQHGSNGDIYSQYYGQDLTKYYAYDTGGYTGDWDDGSGRLAVLHAKELVLNADDTANMLSAVNAIRDISNLGSSITNTIANGISSLVKDMLGFGNNSIGTSTDSDATDGGNTFNITAEFPNANNAEEIREAIMSLPTLASQYLSRNGL